LCRTIINGREIVYKENDGTILKPINYNGRIYVPIRAVAEGLECEVDWGSGKYAFVQTPREYEVNGKNTTLYEFYSALTVTSGYNNSGIYVKIDNEELPPQVQEYSYISILVDRKDFDIVEILDEIERGQFPGVLLEKDEFRHTSRFSDGSYMTVMLYDDKKQPIAHSKVTKKDVNYISLGDPMDGIVEEVGAVRAIRSEGNNYFSLFVDYSKLSVKSKGFAYVACSGHQKPITNGDVQKQLGLFDVDSSFMRDIRNYYPDNGFSVSRLPCVLYYLNSDRKVLGYTRVNE